jgi:hypothetical protein
MKRHRVTFAVTVEIDIAEDLIEEVLKPDWQKDFYKFANPEDVAYHLAYNILRNHADLKSLDGFAHRDVGDLKIVSEDWSEESANEVPEREKKRG